jgi:hypothetical protein
MLSLLSGIAQARDFASCRTSFGEGLLYSVQELAVLSDGQSVVLSDDGQVRRYSLDGQLLDRLYWSPVVPYFMDPLVSVVCAPNGDTYVGNYVWSTISRLDTQGEEVQTVGGIGSGQGQFLGITAMAMAPDGEIYVGDFGNDRIVRLTPDLAVSRTIQLPPGPAESDGMPSAAGPDAMAFDTQGRLHVGWASYDGGGFRIITYTPEGDEISSFDIAPLSDIAESTSWFFRDMAFGPDGRLWVLFDWKPEAAKLVTFDQYGEITDTIPLPYASHQFTFAPDGTLVVAAGGYVTDETPSGEYFIEQRTVSGEVLAHWGDERWARERQMLLAPMQAAVGTQGDILVSGLRWGTDESQQPFVRYAWLHRYEPTGALDAVLAAEDNPTEPYFALGPDDSVVRSPIPLLIDRDGNRYLIDSSDYLHYRVTKTDRNGTPLGEWDLGEDINAAVIGRDGFFYVSRTRGVGLGGYGTWSAVEKYDLDGDLVSTWGDGHEDLVHGALQAVDAEGRAYLTDGDVDGVVSLQLYSPEGLMLGRITSAGREVLSSAGPVAINDAGELVMGSGSRVHVFQVNPVLFNDVAWDQWAYDHIYACADAGIVQGYWDNTYRPALAVTRDQMAVYIARALGGGDGSVQVPAGTAFPSFTDVGADHWAYRHIGYCVGAGIVQGYPDGTYRPDEVVNRGQMAVYIARAIASPTGDAGVPEVPAGTPASFTDVSADNEWGWCYRHVEYCAARGVVQGYADGSYRPAEAATRNQMAVYIQRALRLPM